MKSTFTKIFIWWIRNCPTVSWHSPACQNMSSNCCYVPPCPTIIIKSRYAQVCPSIFLYLVVRPVCTYVTSIGVHIIELCQPSMNKTDLIIQISFQSYWFASCSLQHWHNGGNLRHQNVLFWPKRDIQRCLPRYWCDGHVMSLKVPFVWQTKSKARLNIFNTPISRDNWGVSIMTCVNQPQSSLCSTAFCWISGWIPNTD